MKYRLATVFLLLIAALSLPAQDGERIEALKIGFITEKLSLTPAEAQQFWPVYNAYMEEKKKLRKEMVMMRMEARMNAEDLSDKELREMADNYVQFKRQDAELATKYHESFANSLPPRKLLKFYRAEEEFPMWLLRQARLQGAGAERPMMQGGGGFRRP